MLNLFNSQLVPNKKNKTGLQYIKIIKLFDRDNVELHFSNEVNIFIGENGLGKTTILNCIYYILKKKFEKLDEITFEQIVVKFSAAGSELRVNKNDISKFVAQRNPEYKLKEYKAHRIIDDIYSSYDNYMFSDVESIEAATKRVALDVGLSYPVAKKYVIDYKREHKYNKKKHHRGDIQNVERLITAIENNINQNILYLTTYRRIENDFSNLIRRESYYGERDLLIQFGMSDVESSINNTLSLIRRSSRESFNKMTGVLLKQYRNGYKDQDELSVNKQINTEMAKIILDRLGSEISKKVKNDIIRLIESAEIDDLEYVHLKNLIIKLIESYDKDKIYDEKIQRFVSTCNKYLNGKEFVYNQSELTLNIYSLDRALCNARVDGQSSYSKGKESNIINLSHLSSGEKQIVSLFSKLYLENNRDSILIIDEPELSISMKWQRMLLPDIMRSGKCRLLLTVTHSPFIFENEFDDDAIDMRRCIDPSLY